MSRNFEVILHGLFLHWRRRPTQREYPPTKFYVDRPTHRSRSENRGRLSLSVLGSRGTLIYYGEVWFWFLGVTLERCRCILTDEFSILPNKPFPPVRGVSAAARCEMSQGKHPAAAQSQPLPDASKDVALRKQSNKTAISKSEHCRHILAVLACNGIGVVDDRLIKHEAGDRARANQGSTKNT